MHKLILNHLGPIKWCELECTQFMTLTGFQASGKSTIAKAVYFFRTVKDDILEIAEKQALQRRSIGGSEDGPDMAYSAGLKKDLRIICVKSF